MKTLKNWTAKRAGQTITVRGIDAETGEPVKLTKCVSLEASWSPSLGPFVACIGLLDGADHRLVLQTDRA